jgi:hypothetical protein
MSSRGRSRGIQSNVPPAIRGRGRGRGRGNITSTPFDIRSTDKLAKGKDGFSPYLLIEKMHSKIAKFCMSLFEDLIESLPDFAFGEIFQAR